MGLLICKYSIAINNVIAAAITIAMTIEFVINLVNTDCLGLLHSWITKFRKSNISVLLGNLVITRWGYSNWFEYVFRGCG